MRLDTKTVTPELLTNCWHLVDVNFVDNYSAAETPRLLWSTPQNHVIFEGQNSSIKCIFAGL